MRNGSDVSVIRQIIDIVDCKSILYSQLYERKKVYIENNFKLETIDENKNCQNFFFVVIFRKNCHFLFLIFLIY